MEISISDVKYFFDRIIEKLQTEGVGTLSISTDYYWIITTDEWSNFDKTVEPAVGSLRDDWESLQKTKKPDVPFTYVDIDRLSAVLRAISQERNPPIPD